MSTENISKTATKLINLIDKSSTASHQKLGENISSSDSRSLRTLKGILDQAIGLAESREQNAKENEEKRIASNNELRSLLLDTMRNSDAYNLAKDSGDAKSPEDLLKKLFPNTTKSRSVRTKKKTIHTNNEPVTTEQHSNSQLSESTS